MSQPINFVVLSTGLDTFKEVRSALANDDRTRLLAGGDDTEQLHAEIVRLKPDAAIVVIGPEPEASFSYIRRLCAECEGVAVISAARDASPDLILSSMRAGARDFLRLPIIDSEFKTVIGRTVDHASSRPAIQKRRGRITAVFSSKGGCGTTFVATNVAACMTARSVLVDLNLQAGDLPLFLGIEPKYSIADVVENINRLDDALLTSYVRPYSSGLGLLAAPREADSADEIEPEHIFEAFEKLREKYDFVIVDPQHTFDAITLAALDQADDIVLVLTLDIPAIRSAQRALEIFDRLGYPRNKVSIVVNRFSKQIDLDLRQVESFLGEKVAGFISSDYQTAVTSINLGQPLVLSQPSSRIAQELRQVAAAVVGEQALADSPAAPRRSIWSTLMGKPKPDSKQIAEVSIQETLRPSLSR